MLTNSLTKLSLVALIACASSCSETAGTAETIPVTIESQDNIVSETGVLELTAGTLAVHSVALTGETREVQLLGPTVLDLSQRALQVPLPTQVPPGSYTGMRIALAPNGEGNPVLDVDVRSQTLGDEVRALSFMTMDGTIIFPEGPRSITELSQIELHISLRGMFFYLAPLEDAIDGTFTADEEHRDFLTMDLIGMFDLRVSQ